ncbi:zinc finger protein 462 isoform X3 [Syngnathus scovelli]|nr:zinc finger protein 462 isoform X3 [Syngnathus scovelli]
MCVNGVVDERPHDSGEVEGQTHGPIADSSDGGPSQQRPPVEGGATVMTSDNGMQKEDTDDDTMHNQDAHQEQPHKPSFQCSRCPLEFTSEVFLQEHLGHVHGDGPDFNNHAKKDFPQNTPESSHDILKTDPRDVLNHLEDDDENLTADITKKPETEMMAVSANHHDEETKDDEEEHSISTSRVTLNLSRDLKTYKKPVQTSTASKYFTVTDNQPDSEPEDQSKNQSNNESDNESNDLARAIIDISHKHAYLQEDSLYLGLMRPIIQTPPPKDKKTSNADKTTPEATDKKELSFEVSEDDEDKNPPTYSCKHCNHKDGSLKHLSFHYHQSHPYVRTNSDYIRDENDGSATFRCLVCPVEFPKENDLRSHYGDKHAGSLDIFNLGLEGIDLAYKCFTCTFTTNALEKLKEHYKDRHPAASASNPLMFLKYVSAPCREDPSPVKTPALENPEPDIALYQCNKCPFRHRSVIVVQVHYQKNHPEESVTIDKIKRQAAVTPSKRPQCLNSEAETKDQVLEAQPELAVSEKVGESSKAQMKCDEKVTGDKMTSSIHGEVKGTSEALTKNKDKVLKTSSPEKVRKTSNVVLKSKKVKLFKAESESVLPEKVDSPEERNNCVDPEQTHHQAEDLVQNGLAGTTSRDSNGSKLEELTPKCKSSTSNIYARPENLFFCYKCNYGNPSIKGVMVHQFRTHDKLRTTSEAIVTYTTKLLNSLEKSVAQAENQSFSPLLPLPILNKGDEHTFFCHFCHYRRSTVSKVVQHYAKRHNGCVATPKQIQSYTFRTLELLQRTDVGEGQQPKKFKQPAPQKHKNLQCKSCLYKTQNPNLFRLHVRKCQRGNHSSSGVLKVYLKQANVQAGYQCDLCTFSHKKSSVLYKHYRQEHPESRSSLDFITTRLKEGQASSHLKKNSRIKGEPDESHAGGQSETKTYSCRACSFKASSVITIREHYRAVHPWCLKEDGVVPGVDGQKKSSGKNKDDSSGCFDDYQIPLEMPGVSPKGAKSAAKSPLPEDGDCKESEHSVEEETHMHVFKCLYCSYVNTKHQGVLTHCQMMHSALQSRAESLYVDEAHFDDWNQKHEGQEGDASHFRGYMCQLCPQTHETEKKLRRHHERDHGETSPAAASDEPKMPKSATYKIKMTLFRCQQCSYSCSNKMAFGRHMRLKHKSPAFQVCRYTCVLCSNSYFKKKRLGSHYQNKHGQEAYLKHFLPLCEQTPADAPSRPEVQASNKSKRLVYKCPLCPYVNSRPHGMATHCQMMHPDLPVRVNEFERGEVLISSNYQAGTNNKRGYLCSLCEAICMSLKKLAIHCSRKHSGSSKQETSQDGNSQASAVEADPKTLQRVGNALYKCSLCSYSSMIRKRLAAHYTNRHGKKAFHKHFVPLYLRKVNKAPSSPEAPENAPEGEELLYKCQLCEYRTWARRYLTYHYNKTHQLDVGTRDRLLMAYNKRKRPIRQDPPPDWELSLQDGEQTAASTRCKKCSDLSFDSPQLLLAHYCASHGMERRRDFTVIHPAGRNTGVYRCNRCRKTLNGVKKLSRHLDRHREKSATKVMAKKTTGTPLEKVKSNALDATADDLPGCSAPPDQESPPLSRIIATSPQKAGEHEQADAASLSEIYACSQCQRTFKSRNGVRTHERSHQALAAIKKLPASLSQLNLNKYLLHKPGTIRPFQCSICFYRTNLMGLWNNHLLKKHLDIVIETCDDQQENSTTTQSADGDAPHLGCGVMSWAKTNKGCTKDWYLEPPEVQRQLSHFSLMAQKGASAAMPAARRMDGGGYFRCENCSFFCEDMPSMRRHYLSRHGRKIFTCKDCDFFTGLKRAMRVHMDTDHSTFQKEVPPPDCLRCPFCLYQSNNKNNMIDHVLLHREERVVPMEVRRPKLSRYLQGLVFRCHVCTYASASADNLRSHSAKHQPVKPYRCRLCYFDCARLDELEAHLCAKHQVMRNHELVGQVSLEQLENVKLNERPEYEETQAEQMSNPENAQDVSRHVKETDGRKPTEKLKSDFENHLRDMATVKQEHQNDAAPLESKDAESQEVEEEKVEWSPDKDEEKAHLSKLQTLNNEAHVENGILRHTLDQESGTPSSSHGEQLRSDIAESSGYMAKKSLKRETLAPLLGHSLETSQDDKAHKRKMCDGLKEEEMNVEEGRDCENQKKRLKMEDTCTRQDGDMSELKGVHETFPCNLCGRNLQSEEELKRHASRHGM